MVPVKHLQTRFKKSACLCAYDCTTCHPPSPPLLTFTCLLPSMPCPSGLECVFLAASLRHWFPDPPAPYNGHRERAYSASPTGHMTHANNYGNGYTNPQQPPRRRLLPATPTGERVLPHHIPSQSHRWGTAGTNKLCSAPLEIWMSSDVCAFI